MPAGAILVVFLLVQAACIAGALMFPDEFRYLSPQNLAILMKAIPVLGCLALGAGILMIAGEFDLSIGSVYTFTAVVMAVQVGDGMSAFVAAPLAILIGMAIGLLNGLGARAAAAHRRLRPQGPAAARSGQPRPRGQDADLSPPNPRSECGAVVTWGWRPM